VIVFTLHDANGAILSVDPAKLSVVASAGVTVGSFTVNSDGSYSASVTSTKPGILQIKVTLDGVPVGQVEVHFIAIIPPITQGANGMLTVSATGFWPGELVDVWVQSSPVQVAKGLVADANGNVTATFALPNGFPDGKHTVYFVGVRAGTTAAVSFTLASGGTIISTGGSVAPPGGVASGLAVVLMLCGAVALVLRRRMASIVH